MSTTSPIQVPEEPTAPIARHLLRIDPLLLAAAIGLSLCSFMVLRPLGGIYAGEAHRQLLYIAAGVLLALAVSRFDYTRLRDFRYVIYALMIVINVAVFAFAAPSGQDSQRRIPFPGVSLQPSEFGKLLLVLALAAFAVRSSRRLGEHRTTARLVLLGLIPAMIVIKQSDLGDALVYLIITGGVIFFLGTSWKHLAALAVLVIAAAVIVLTVAPALHINILHGYQIRRLTTFIDPPANCVKHPTCWQGHQALVAVGSGGKLGTGAAGASQATGGFIPEADSDFVFATLSEMYGFAGAAVVLSLYALLIWRALRIVTLAKNLYGTLLAGGVLAMFMFEIFLNIGVTLGILPITGIALPLLSYGGSSVLTSFLAVGLLESIHVQAQLASAGKARVMLA